jgi:hypothetical protein
LKPDEAQAALAACVAAIMQTAWQKAMIILTFNIQNSTGSLMKVVFMRPKIIGGLTNFVSVTTKSKFIVTNFDFIRANL